MPTRHSPKPDLPLAGRVAVVAGATRGAGRGIAKALGEAGATVYCTGRSVVGHPSQPQGKLLKGRMLTSAGCGSDRIVVPPTNPSEKHQPK